MVKFQGRVDSLHIKSFMRIAPDRYLFIKLHDTALHIDLLSSNLDASISIVPFGTQGKFVPDISLRILPRAPNNGHLNNLFE